MLECWLFWLLHAHEFDAISLRGRTDNCRNSGTPTEELRRRIREEARIPHEEVVQMAKQYV